MRKLVTWVLVSLGIAALVRRLRRRGEPASPVVAEPAPAPPAPEPPADDPADELRAKLAASRPPDEPAAATSADAEATAEERRADVHEQGQAALDEMRSSDEE